METRSKLPSTAIHHAFLWGDGTGRMTRGVETALSLAWWVPNARGRPATACSFKPHAWRSRLFPPALRNSERTNLRCPGGSPDASTVRCRPSTRRRLTTRAAHLTRRRDSAEHHAFRARRWRLRFGREVRRCDGVRAGFMSQAVLGPLFVACGSETGPSAGSPGDGGVGGAGATGSASAGSTSASSTAAGSSASSTATSSSASSTAASSSASSTATSSSASSTAASSSASTGGATASSASAGPGGAGPGGAGPGGAGPGGAGPGGAGPSGAGPGGAGPGGAGPGGAGGGPSECKDGGIGALDCTTCQQQDDCCDAQVDACLSNPACPDYNNCLADCISNDTACADDCMNSYGPGVNDYDLLIFVSSAMSSKVGPRPVLAAPFACRPATTAGPSTLTALPARTSKSTLAAAATYRPVRARPAKSAWT